MNKSASNLDGIQQFSEEINKVSVDTESSETTLLSAGKDVCDVIMSADEKQIITCSLNGPIRIWSSESGALERCISSGCEEGVSQLYLVCNGALLVGHCRQPGVATAYILKVCLQYIALQ